MKSLYSRVSISPSALFRALPLLSLVLLIAGAVACGPNGISQSGDDDETVPIGDIRTGDMRTNEVESFDIITILYRDAIRAITDPSFVPPAEAATWMEIREHVIGLEIAGEKKAYPINMLSRHEIVNDVVGGKPVAVTW